MSDLRNFHTSDAADIGRTRIEPSLAELSVYEASPGFEEAAPLSAFHTVEEDETNNTGRIVGGLAVALMLGAAAIYGYEVSSQSKQPMATQIAAKAPPAKPVATAPDQSADATPAASSAMAGPPATEAMTPAAAPEAVRKAPVRSAHVDSSSPGASTQSVPVDTAPAQGLASVTPPAPSSAGVPEQGGVQPVYPTAPSSSLANSNPAVVAPETQASQTPAPSEQPDQAVQPTTDQAQPAPSTPAPE